MYFPFTLLQRHRKLRKEVKSLAKKLLVVSSVRWCSCCLLCLVVHILRSFVTLVRVFFFSSSFSISSVRLSFSVLFLMLSVFLGNLKFCSVAAVVSNCAHYVRHRRRRVGVHVIYVPLITNGRCALNSCTIGC